MGRAGGKTQDRQKLSNLVSILGTVNMILNKTGDEQYLLSIMLNVLAGNCVISGSMAPTPHSIMSSSWNLLHRLLVLRYV